MENAILLTIIILFVCIVIAIVLFRTRKKLFSVELTSPENRAFLKLLPLKQHLMGPLDKKYKKSTGLKLRKQIIIIFYTYLREKYGIKIQKISNSDTLQQLLNSSEINRENREKLLHIYKTVKRCNGQDLKHRHMRSLYVELSLYFKEKISESTVHSA